MRTFPKGFVIAFGIPAIIIGSLFAYFIAYTTGSIPEGTRYVYRGFSVETRNSKAYSIRIDDPGAANIYVEISGKVFIVKDISKESLVENGFKAFSGNSYRNSLGGVFSRALFSMDGQLKYMSIPHHQGVTLRFAASPTGSQLKLPVRVEIIEEEFGKPLHKEYIYPKIEWR